MSNNQPKSAISALIGQKTEKKEMKKTDLNRFIITPDDATDKKFRKLCEDMGIERGLQKFATELFTLALNEACTEFYK